MAEPLQQSTEQSTEVPRAGEAIHLPGPSYLPVVVALGVTIAVVGVVLNWFVFGAGVLITLIAVGRWIGDTRRDIADLPLEHQTH